MSLDVNLGPLFDKSVAASVVYRARMIGLCLLNQSLERFNSIGLYYGLKLLKTCNAIHSFFSNVQKTKDGKQVFLLKTRENHQRKQKSIANTIWVVSSLIELFRLVTIILF